MISGRIFSSRYLRLPRMGKFFLMVFFFGETVPEPNKQNGDNNDQRPERIRKEEIKEHFDH